MAPTPVATNMVIGTRSYRLPESGDVFGIRLATGPRIFGRVIIARPPRTEAPMPESNLLYIYKHLPAGDLPDYSQLTPASLLIPPVWTNRKGWTLGYYTTVRRGSLAATDMLGEHCFEDAFSERYRNERGEIIPHRVEPCGLWGLVSYRWIDDRLSDALGIPRAPEESKQP